MNVNDPSYRMKSLLDNSAGSLISHTIAEEAGSEEESDHDHHNSERFDSASKKIDGRSDVACRACGFESTFVHEGMTPCNRCNAVFYCSTHCRSWDWNSGGHREVCHKGLSGGSSHSIDRHSSRGGSESASSLDADKLFDGITLNGSPDTSPQQADRQRHKRDNNSGSSKKSLSSFLDHPKSHPQPSALPNPFANMNQNDDNGGSGSFESFDDESLCVTNLNVTVTAPLHAITEESQISEAQTADASWRMRDPISPKRNPNNQRMLDAAVPEHDSDGNFSLDYGHQDPQTLQAHDDMVYGVEFDKFGHQSTNSMSAEYGCDTSSNDDVNRVVEHDHDNSMLLELFDSRAYGSSALLDASMERTSSESSKSSSSANLISGASVATDSTSSSIASTSVAESDDDDVESHRTLEDRTDSDKSLLKQFREVYNRPEANAGDTGDFKSSSQRSTCSLREFREIYNSKSSDSTSESSEIDEIPRSFLGSMHLDKHDDDDDEVGVPIVESEHSMPIANPQPQVPSTTNSLQQQRQIPSTSSSLQQARERFKEKKETLNEALNHYKQKFGESAAVEAFDKIAGSKEDKTVGSVELKERTQEPVQTKQTYTSYRASFPKQAASNAVPNGADVKKQNPLLTSDSGDPSEDNVAVADGVNSRYLSYKRSLNDTSVQDHSHVDPSDEYKARKEEEKCSASKISYMKYRRMLKPESKSTQACQSEGPTSVGEIFEAGQAGEEAAWNGALSSDAVSVSKQSHYQQYRCRLREESTNHMVIDGSSASGTGEKRSINAKFQHTSEIPHYTKYRKLLSSRLSTDSPPSDADPSPERSEAQSMYAKYRFSLKEDEDSASKETHEKMEIKSDAMECLTKKSSESMIGQNSRYFHYRGVLKSSSSNDAISSKDHTFSKDDVFLGMSISKSIQRVETTSNSAENIPLYMEYRRTLVAPLLAKRELPENLPRQSNTCSRENYSYSDYRRSLNAPSSQAREHDIDLFAESVCSSESSSSTEPQSLLGSRYSAYRETLPSTRIETPEAHSVIGGRDDGASRKTSEEQSNYFSSGETMLSNEESAPGSKYAAYRSSHYESVSSQAKQETTGVEDGITHSWYRNYRDSLKGVRDDSIDKMESDDDAKKSPVDVTPSAHTKSIDSGYTKYRQNLHVRFKSQTGSSDEADQASKKAESEKSVADPQSDSSNDDSHNSGMESLVPSERLPEVIASPTSRSTSSVTSNTDIDNTDATLMPRYLYYKFSLEKAEPAMKNSSQVETIKVEEQIHQGEASVHQTKSESTCDIPLVDLPAVALDPETERDFTILGLKSSAAWNHGGHATFLKIWRQVEQDVAVIRAERMKTTELRFRTRPSAQLYKPIPPTLPSVKLSSPVPQPTAYISPHADIENQQVNPHCDHASTSSTGTQNDKHGMWQKLLSLFLRHFIPPLILILFAIGIGLGIMLTRRNIGSDESSNAPTASVVSPGQTPAARAEIYQTLYDMISEASIEEGLPLDSPSSPQSMAFNWLLKTPELFERYSRDRILQRYALGCFYYSTEGDNWLIRTNWLSDTDECTWYTLTIGDKVCDENGMITKLDLSYNNLRGSLPSELAILTKLKIITLMGSGNESLAIQGVLPTELGLLTELQTINVRNNALFGGLPTELGQLSDLVLMDFGMNRFSLDIPIEFGKLTSLKTMNLEMNQLTGDVPPQLNGLGELEILALGSNRLSGRVQLDGRLSSLQILNLEENRFTSISSAFGQLSNLETLTMYENDVTGSLQSEISQLVSLKRLSLHSNRLFGRLPEFIGDLEELLDLDLSFNAFSGPIPTSIGQLQKLTRLDLRSNFLAGTIPKELGLLTSATIIRIDDNDISGSVSDDVCRAYETSRTRFYSDCGSREVSCPPESACCTFCCTDGEGCDCRLPEQLNQLCFVT